MQTLRLQTMGCVSHSRHQAVCSEGMKMTNGGGQKTKDKQQIARAAKTEARAARGSAVRKPKKPAAK